MIRVLFYTGDDMISKVIKKITKSEITHVSIQLDRFHVAEAVINKPLSIVHLKDYSCVIDMVDIEVAEWQYDLIIKKVLSELDKKYDVEDIFSFIFPFIKGSEKSRICSEFVIEVLKVIGYKFENRIYSPSELYELIK